MTVFARSIIANFGQNAGFSKKKNWFASNDYIGHVKTKIQYIILKQKASRIKWCIILENILIRTGDIGFIRMDLSWEPHSRSMDFLSV